MRAFVVVVVVVVVFIKQGCVQYRKVCKRFVKFPICSI